MAKATNKIIFDENFVRGCEERTKEVIRFNMLEEARFFTLHVWPEILADKEFQTGLPALYRRLERIYKINSILQLGRLPEEEILSLFESGIELYFLEMVDNLNLWELVKGKLITIMDLQARNDFKKNISKALLRNKHLITRNKLRRDEKEYEPSITNWLVDYTSAVGVGLNSVVKINEYLTRNENCQKLSDPEKNIVRSLIIFYERLKYSSQEPDGLEESITLFSGGQWQVLREGRFEDFDPKVVKLLGDYEKSLSPEERKQVFGAEETAEPGAKAAFLSAEESARQEIFSAYAGDAGRQKAVLAEEEKLKKADKFKLRDEFMAAVQDKNINKTMAAFRVLARSGDLGSFLKEDAKLNKFMAGVWEKKFNKALAAEFIKNADQLKFVRLFLRYILEERLGLGTSDAARLGLQLGNIFVNLGKKEYNKIAYYDVGSKGFKWFEE
ncbi:MAG: hypothetical protein A2663_00310 [Candidatus Buchananbacteria bacterium RIFCSPHIGHO2_01_FULL_46_12]|uniref:Uncharacterized protein n=1 Tax=Candidatus Buchananbacteria bacterium RIFCSPHIGHO2_01_FULL_46_12 TaxID=1797536 RepID=A0A1G1Y4R9_9BACT|nr:MAG: hypothetical protein A2663_00310 [Candidatus Buchananbacteria bacterium RIFCSPHIGHO2_01_FULL_46_12]